MHSVVRLIASVTIPLAFVLPRMQAFEPPSIGSVVTRGGPYSQIATLFEANTVTTNLNAREVRLRSGDTVRLGSGSRGTFYRDHMVLEQGGGRVRSRGKYRVEVKQLTFEPRSGSEATITLLHSGSVAMYVSAGSVGVLKGGGVLAEIQPGKPLEFALTPQLPSSGPPPRPGPGPGPGAGAQGGVCPVTAVLLQGALSYDKGPPAKIFITDDLTGIKAQLGQPAAYVFVPPYGGNVVNDAMNGVKVAVCLSVAARANPDTNTGLVLGGGFIGNPQANRSTTQYPSGGLTKDSDGKYWLVDSATGLKYELDVTDCSKKIIMKVDDAYDKWKKEHDAWDKQKPPRGPEPKLKPVIVGSTQVEVDAPPKGSPFPLIKCVKQKAEAGSGAGGLTTKEVVITGGSIAAVAAIAAIVVDVEDNSPVSPSF